jgi:hypothetical protein
LEDELFRNETQNNKQQSFKSFQIVDLEEAYLRVRRLSVWLIGTLCNRHGETIVVTSSDARAKVGRFMLYVGSVFEKGEKEENRKESQ